MDEEYDEFGNYIGPEIATRSDDGMEEVEASAWVEDLKSKDELAEQQQHSPMDAQADGMEAEGKLFK